MTEQELTRLIAEGEGPYPDFKAAKVRPARLAHTATAGLVAARGQGRNQHYILP
jgi:hypothetical protein